MTSYSHCLEPLAFSCIDRFKEIDAWDLEIALGTDEKGRQLGHYAYIAADILECMFQSGRVERRGNGNPKKPELGNFFYFRKESGPFSETCPLIDWFTTNYE